MFQDPQDLVGKLRVTVTIKKKSHIYGQICLSFLGLPLSGKV